MTLSSARRKPSPAVIEERSPEVVEADEYRGQSQRGRINLSPPPGR
jgi:hypothetical protein